LEKLWDELLVEMHSVGRRLVPSQPRWLESTHQRLAREGLDLPLTRAHIMN